MFNTQLILRYGQVHIYERPFGQRPIHIIIPSINATQSCYTSMAYFTQILINLSISGKAVRVAVCTM